MIARMKSRQDEQYRHSSSIKLPVFITFLILFPLFFSLRTFNPALRYSVYILPFLILFVLYLSVTLKRRFQVYIFRKYFRPYIILYGLMVTYSLVVLILKRSVYSRFFEEAFLIFAPLLFASFLFLYYAPNRKGRYIKYTFWGMIVVYFLHRGANITSVISDLGYFISQAFITSSIKTESGLASVFGLFGLYFFLQGNKKYSLLAFLFLLLSFKRIAFLGVLLSLLVYLLISKIVKIRIARPTRKILPLLFVGLNALFILGLMQFVRGTFDDRIIELVHMTPNQLTVGRYVIYQAVLEQNEPSWLGIGLGKVTSVLENEPYHLKNLHSDVFKFYLEWGPVFFVILIYNLYAFNLHSKKMFILMVYLNTLLLTDNVFIYFYVMFIFYLLQGILFSETVDLSLNKLSPSVEMKTD